MNTCLRIVIVIVLLLVLMTQLGILSVASGADPTVSELVELNKKFAKIIENHDAKLDDHKLRLGRIEEGQSRTQEQLKAIDKRLGAQEGRSSPGDLARSDKDAATERQRILEQIYTTGHHEMLVKKAAAQLAELDRRQAEVRQELQLTRDTLNRTREEAVTNRSRVDCNCTPSRSSLLTGGAASQPAVCPCCGRQHETPRRWDAPQPPRPAYTSGNPYDVSRAYSSTQILTDPQYPDRMQITIVARP